MIIESDGKPLETTMSRKITRRGALKLIASTGTALATGRHINTVHAISATGHKSSTESQDAKALIDESSDFDIEPPPRPETRDPFVQLIDTTTLSIDPELPKEKDRKLVIVGISENPFANEFTDLSPNNVYDRLDRVFVELCRGTQHRRDEIRSIPDRLLSKDEFTNTPMNRRALNKGEVPSQLSLEEFTQKMIDHPNLKISLWAYDPDSDDPNKNKLMRFDPRKGMEVRILKGKPKVGFNEDGQGHIELGYTHEIIDGKLHLGLYLRDFKPDSGVGGDPVQGIYTPSFNVDSQYTGALSQVIQDLILYGGNKQMHDGIDVKYLEKTNKLPNASLFPEVAQLACGELRSYEVNGVKFQQYDTAPVLHIQSPSVDAANRYR